MDPDAIFSLESPAAPNGGRQAGLGVTDDPFAPLAVRMRPRELDELVGQAHLLGPRRHCGGWSTASG